MVLCSRISARVEFSTVGSGCDLIRVSAVGWGSEYVAKT